MDDHPQYGDTVIWLVVSTPLKKISWDDYSQYMEKLNMFQTVVITIKLLTVAHAGIWCHRKWRCYPQIAPKLLCIYFAEELTLRTQKFDSSSVLWCLSTYDIKYQQEETCWILDIDSFFQGINMGVSEKKNAGGYTPTFLRPNFTRKMMKTPGWISWLVKSPKITSKNHGVH